MEIGSKIHHPLGVAVYTGDIKLNDKLYSILTFEDLSRSYIPCDKLDSLSIASSGTKITNMGNDELSDREILTMFQPHKIRIIN